MENCCQWISLKSSKSVYVLGLAEADGRGFKSRVNRPKPTVQEYFRAIREQQVITDHHIDRLGVGKTPS